MHHAPSSILITGAAQRLGRAMALHLAEQGYDIVLHYHSNVAGAEKTQDEIEQMGRSCHLLQADLSEGGEYDALIEQAYKASPSLGGLINNASVFLEAGIGDTTPELFDQQLTVNLRAPFFLTQAYAAQVKQGCIINMLDTFISKTSSSYFHYLLTKKALAAFTQMAARELAPEIRVNAVAPGTILPNGKRFGEAYMKQKAKANPMKRLGQIEEVCQAAYALLTQDYMIGQILYVDGGERLV